MLSNQILDRLFLAERQNSLFLQRLGAISRQRNQFISRFGLERLAGFSKEDLFGALHTSRPDSLFYWLSQKEDDEFRSSYFRAGASPLLPPMELTSAEERAPSLDEIERFVFELQQAATILKQKTSLADELQAKLERIAPEWHTSAWFHQYLHLVFPEQVAWYHHPKDAQAALYRLGYPALGNGLFAWDAQILKLTQSFHALQTLPPHLRYHCFGWLRPRAHVCVQLQGDLTTAKRWIERGIARSEGTAPAISRQIKPGSLLALAQDGQTLVALGEVIEAVSADEWKIQWLSTDYIELQHGEVPQSGLHLVEPSQWLVAEMEQTWLRIKQPTSLDELRKEPQRQHRRDLSPEKVQARLGKVLDTFFVAEPPPPDEPPLSRGAIDSWSANLCLGEERGLFLWLSRLAGLPSFVKKLRLISAGASQLLIAANLKANASQVTTTPSTEDYCFIAEGFEEEEALQKALAHLQVKKLSSEEPTVFRIDASGVGHRLSGNELSPGQSYRVLLPPALATGLVTSSLQDGWRSLELSLPAVVPEEISREVTSLGLRIGAGAFSMRWIGNIPERYQESKTGERYACFLKGESTLIEVSGPQTSKDEAQLFLVGEGQYHSVRLGARETSSWLFLVEQLSLGQYVIEVSTTDTTIGTDRLAFAVLDAHVSQNADVVVCIGEERLHIKEIFELEKDLSLLGEEGLLIKAPPLWPVRFFWLGLQPLSLPEVFADEEGNVPLEGILRLTQKVRQEELVSELRCDFGELGLLRFQHSRQPNPGELHQEIYRLWNQRRGFLSAFGGNFSQISDQWLKPLLSLFGYRMQSLSTPSAPTGTTAAILWVAERTESGVTTKPSKILVFSSPLDLAASTLRTFASHLCTKHNLRTALLTDGLSWTAQGTLARLVLDIPRMAAKSADDLEFGTFLLLLQGS